MKKLPRWGGCEGERLPVEEKMEEGNDEKKLPRKGDKRARQTKKPSQAGASKRITEVERLEDSQEKRALPSPQRMAREKKEVSRGNGSPVAKNLVSSDEVLKGAATPASKMQAANPKGGDLPGQCELAAVLGVESRPGGSQFHHVTGGGSPPETCLPKPPNGWAYQPDAPEILGMGRETREKRDTDFKHTASYVDVIDWLESKLDFFLHRLCRVKPTGRIFPLPTSFLLLSQFFSDDDAKLVKMIRVVCCSLNSLNGEGVFGKEVISKAQQTILAEIRRDCIRVLEWDRAVEVVPWGHFFRVRGVDYKGEEILTAQTMQWENVEPALPLEVGAIPLREVCELGCKHFVVNFPEYLISSEDSIPVKPAKVMVPPAHWETFCARLLERGIFDRIHEDDLHTVGGEPILNGLFGVTKGEFHNNYEVLRIIMNMVPGNSVVRGIDGDISTLPGWSGMTPLELMPEEDLVVSSEDVRCFFYIFKIPRSWHSVMAFNRPLPSNLAGKRPGKWYPCSAVLPMGFKNSVSIAQHVHRYIAKQAAKRASLGAEHELRKDRGFPNTNPLYRIYLDNFDSLQKVSKKVSEAIEGKVSPLILGLREEYASLGIPRHPKKAVANFRKAEVQGAVIDGQAGVAYPKPEKLLKYAHLTWLLLRQRQATQKQVQVVGGGLVYFAMFRRPLLGALNAIWVYITSFNGFPPFIELPIPREVKEELARFLGLLPLAFMDFRLNISGQVTASDASEQGGGVTVSTKLTPAGHVACGCPVRGDLVEPQDVTQVLTVGLFDGVGALRVAADVLGWNVQGHVSVEIQPEAHRVVEAHFPQVIKVSDVADITAEMVQSWAQRFSQVGLVLLGAGPPCQGVSGLNAARRGALRDQRSCLFLHVQRVRQLLCQFFPWAQIRSLMESVASMDFQDEETMSKSFGSKPLSIDASGVSLAHRPRLYWLDWEVSSGTGVQIEWSDSGRSTVTLSANINEADYLEPGWSRTRCSPLPTFTTARPRATPGYKPAGLHQCLSHEQERWQQDAFRFPPYQYRDQNCLQNRKNEMRVPSINEREVIMGFPKDFTNPCVPKGQQGNQTHLDLRLSLMGNSWNVTVVSWLLSHLGMVLGLNGPLTIQEIVARTAPGSTTTFQSFLLRPYMSRSRKVSHTGSQKMLVHKLMSLVSLKGEDILLQSASEDLVKYHRLRSSVPAKLWSWQTVTGWQWTGSKEHINCLELRAVLTALKWRLERRGVVRSKFVHLIDSLVCLHALSRGRTSSRKLRRTLLRTNALLLACHCAAVWTYVHTKQNPADKPSRRVRKRKWLHAKKAS